MSTSVEVDAFCEVVCHWHRLSGDLIERIVDSLPPNEATCSLRLVNKALADRFRSRPYLLTVHLSQPAPQHAFAHHWGTPSSMRSLTYAQRHHLLQLIAASGSIPNLELAARFAGVPIAPMVAATAARAGQLHVCRWLLEHGCDLTKDPSVMAAAGAGGHQEIVEWLQQCGASIGTEAVWAAAQRGHVALMETLLDRSPPSRSANFKAMLLSAVCEACELATLQRVFASFEPRMEGAELGGGGEEEDEEDDEERVRLSDWNQQQLMISAAESRTPDWRTKVEWLERLGCRKPRCFVSAICRCPDAIERLEWLASRPGGERLGSGAIVIAAAAGNADLLRHLLTARAGPAPAMEGAESLTWTPAARAAAASTAARMGGLEALQVLLEHGCPVEPEALESAAGSGKVAVVACVAEALGERAALTAPVFNAAAAAGGVEVLAWLRQRGCPWDAATWEVAARAGCEEALEWLAEQGCPMPDDGGPYAKASANADQATLRCLRRLGCPWGPEGRVVRDCLSAQWEVGAGAAVVRWLMSEGCPVGREDALKVAAADYCSEAEAAAWAG